MRPTVIPDWMLGVFPDRRRIVVAPPGGNLVDPSIAAVEALVGEVELGPGRHSHAFTMAAVPEGDDLRMLSTGGLVLITILSPQLTPFDVLVIANPGGYR